MKAVLFGTRLSPYVEKCARAMQLKRIEFELVSPKGFQDFKKWNPTTGKMPVFELDGKRIYDSSRIVRKLDALVPEPALFASDPALARKQSFVEDWSDESLYWYSMAFRWAPENQTATVKQISGMLPGFLRPLAGILFPWQIGGAARGQGLAREPLAVLIEALGERFDEVLAMLGDKPFLFADQVGAADLAIFGQVETMKSGPTPQCVELVTQRPDLVAYLDRVDRASAPKATKSVGKLRAA